MNRSPDFDAWVDDARSRDVLAEAQALGARLKRSGIEHIGPCPVCGGTDRFGVNPRKRVFLCRGSGAAGDVIALVQYITGRDFIGACEQLTGRPVPSGKTGEIDHAALAAREEKRRTAAAEREAEAQQYREKERRRAWELWHAFGDPSPVNAYLAGRGLERVPLLRCHPAMPYWVHETETDRFGRRRSLPREIYRGPAMMAPIVDAKGRFSALHITWIEADGPGKKATIVHPHTGEILDAKKSRGSVMGCAIRLIDRREIAGFERRAARLVVGEGIETTLSAMLAERERRPELWWRSSYWAGVNLGNLGGRALESVPHPGLTITDARGRVRQKRVPGPVPDPEHPGLMPPEYARDVLLLGEGDSDLFATDLALKRAAARWERGGRQVSIAWAPRGMDHNDIRVAS
jgi:hypothetical protein